MELLRLLRRHKLLVGLVTAATLCLAGNAVSNAASTPASLDVSVVNNNLLVIVGHGFTGTGPVSITATAGTPLAPLTANPRKTDGGFATNTFLPDGYSGAVSVIAKQGTITANGNATATGTGASSPAAPTPAPAAATTGASTTGTTGAATSSTGAPVDTSGGTAGVDQQGSTAGAESTAAAAPAPASGGAASADDPSGNGIEAAVANKWGTPVDQHHFAGTSLDGFGPYDTGDTSDFGLRVPSQVSVKGGVLTLTGIADGHTGAGSFDFSQEHGRWESRIKATSDGSCWRPVALLWPDNGGSDDPGEFDYAESGGNLKEGATFFLHYPGGQDSQDIKTDQTQWHNYAVEWEADHVTGYLDGKAYWNMTDTSHVPKSPFHETFQLDAQDGDTPCSGNNATMEIDWLKVYKG